MAASSSSSCFTAHQEEGVAEWCGDGAVVGIDLGTTFSTVVATQGSSLQVVRNREDGDATASFIQFRQEQGQRLVFGQEARATASKFPESTFYNVKQLLAKRWADVDQAQFDYRDALRECQEGNRKGFVNVEVNGVQYPPEFLSGLLLRHLKLAAERQLDKPVTCAVITVPSSFGELQRQATRRAAEIAGLHLLEIIDEPTAAALDSLRGQTQDLDRTIMVFDFGGGTLDVTLLQVDQGVFKVIGKGGNENLGGERIDGLVTGALERDFARSCGPVNPSVRRILRNEAERMKRLFFHPVLENAQAVHHLFLPCGDQVAEFTMLRSQYLQVIQSLLLKTLETVQEALENQREMARKAGDEPVPVQEILMIGGSSRLRPLDCLLKAFFKAMHNEGVYLNRSINPDLAVAQGAALRALTIADPDSPLAKQLRVKNVVQVSYGVTARNIITQANGTTTKRTFPPHVDHWTLQDKKTVEVVVAIPRGRPISEAHYQQGFSFRKLKEPFHFKVFDVTNRPGRDAELQVVREAVITKEDMASGDGFDLEMRVDSSNTLEVCGRFRGSGQRVDFVPVSEGLLNREETRRYQALAAEWLPS